MAQRGANHAGSYNPYHPFRLDYGIIGTEVTDVGETETEEEIDRLGFEV